MRWTIGPSYGTVAFQTSLAPSDTPDAGPPKLDVEVTTEEGIVDGAAIVTVPPYGPAGYSVLAEVRVYLVHEGTPPPATAEDYVASDLPFGSFDARSLVGTGGRAPVKLPEVADGKYFLQILTGFED